MEKIDQGNKKKWPTVRWLQVDISRSWTEESADATLMQSLVLERHAKEFRAESV